MENPCVDNSGQNFNGMWLSLKSAWLGLVKHIFNFSSKIHFDNKNYLHFFRLTRKSVRNWYNKQNYQIMQKFTFQHEIFKTLWYSMKLNSLWEHFSRICIPPPVKSILLQTIISIIFEIGRINNPTSITHCTERCQTVSYRIAWYQTVIYRVPHGTFMGRKLWSVKENNSP